MQTKTTFKFLSASLMSVILTGCGGGSGSALDNTIPGNTGNSSSSSSVNPADYRIGNGTGSSFISGAIASSSTATTLFEGDKTQLSVNVVDPQGNPISKAVSVKFDSPCIAANISSIGAENAVNTVNGVATIQYQVGKCDIDDKVTATIATGTSTLEASVVLPINTRRMGSGFGSSFVNNKLEVGIGENLLSTGGSTSITAYIVNSAGEPVTEPMSVTFSSPCLTANNSSITGGNIVTSAEGRADANYVSKGCAGSSGIDAIKATTTFRGAVLTATANIFVKADSAQTISFVSAKPELISIKGTGGTETSTLTFQVLGQTGNPVKGVCVNFAPSTVVGGLALVPSKCNPAGPETYGASTDADGLVTTIVQSGTVPTAVRVTATTSNSISTQSSILAVTTGVPDQNSASLSLTNIEPVAWQYDGIESLANIRLADAFNNPVPDGTAVTFTASGGAIDGSCKTLKGACSVVWRSQNPRPTPAGKLSFSNITAAGYSISCSDGSKECRSGRVAILATAIGNESFIDGNGNGLYDDITKDTFVTGNGILNDSTKNLPVINTPTCSRSAPNSSAAFGITNSCDDLREAYIDKNFTGDRDSTEEFLDFNQNGVFDLLPNGKYDGALCSGTAKANGNCTTNKVTVRAETTLAMSCEYPFTGSNGILPGLPATTTLAIGASTQVSFVLADCNGNAMPAGTSVTVSNANFTAGTGTLNISGPLKASTEPTLYTLTLKSDSTITAPSGAVTINVLYSGTTFTYSLKIN